MNNVNSSVNMDKVYKTKATIIRAFAAFILLNYLAIFSIAYFNLNQFRYIRETRAKQLFNETIEQQGRLIATYNRQIIDSILQLYNSPLNKKLRQQNKLSQTDKLQAMRELNAFVTSSEYLLSAYVYNPVYGMLSSDDNFESSDELVNFKDTAALDLLNMASKQPKSLQLLPTLRTYPTKQIAISKNPKFESDLFVLAPEQKYLFTYVLHEGNTALIVNVDAAYLIKIMQTNREQTVLLQMQDGEKLLIGGNAEFAKDLDSNLPDLVDDKQLVSSNFTLLNISGRNYLSAQTYSKTLAANMAYFLPEKQILADVYTLKKQTYLLLFFVLLLFMALHIWLWKQVVNPFAEAVSEVGKLHKFSFNPAKVLKTLRQQQFWRALLSGVYKNEPDFEFVTACKQLDLDFTDEHVYLILPDTVLSSQEIERILSEFNCQQAKIDYSEKTFYLLAAEQVLTEHSSLYVIPKQIENYVSHNACFYSGIYQAKDLAKATLHLLELQKLAHLNLMQLKAEHELYTLSKANGEQTIISNLFSNLLNYTKASDECLAEFWQSLRTYRLASVIYSLRNLAVQLDKRTDEIRESAEQPITVPQLSASYLAQDQLNELLTKDFTFKDLSDILLPKIEYYRQIKLAQHQEQVSSLAEQVSEFVQMNLADFNLSLKLVAAEFRLNPTYLSKLFKEAKDITLSAYITQKRMEAAVDLLVTSDMSNKQICAQIGLENSSYFYALFKKTYGVTPSEYKQSNEQQKGDTD